MKKSIYATSILILLTITNITRGLGSPQQTTTILTTDSNTIISDMGENAFRDGARAAISAQGDGQNYAITKLINSKDHIENQQAATEKTLALVQRLINYALGLISLIAFIILLGAGFQMLTAAGDDSKFGAGKAALSKISKVVLGIAVSWLIISAIFRIIAQIVK